MSTERLLAGIFLPALSVQGMASPAHFPTVSHHTFIYLGSPSHTEPQDLLLQMVARPLTVVLDLILLFHSRHYNLTTSSRAEAPTRSSHNVVSKSVGSVLVRRKACSRV